jgi:hypothetical protein
MQQNKTGLERQQNKTGLERSKSLQAQQDK